MARTQFSSQGDIFIKSSATPDLPPAPRKSKKGLFLKSAGIIAGVVIVVAVITTLAGHGPITNTMVANPASSNPNATIKDFLPQSVTADTNTITRANQSQTQNTYANPQLANTTNSHKDNNSDNGNAGGNFGSINSDLIRLQNQIYQQMQVCVSITVEAQREITQMRVVERQMQDEINELNREINNTNSNEPGGRERRYDLVAERDRVIYERRRLQTEISVSKRVYSNNKINCQRSVQQMQQAKRNLEIQLNQIFNRSININIF